MKSALDTSPLFAPPLNWIDWLANVLISSAYLAKIIIFVVTVSDRLFMLLFEQALQMRQVRHVLLPQERAQGTHGQVRRDQGHQAGQPWRPLDRGEKIGKAAC